MWITGQPTSSMFSRFTDQEKVLHCVPDSTFPRAITLDWLVLQKRSARVSPRRTWPVHSRRDTVIEFSQSVITRAIDTNLYVRDLYSPSENLGLCNTFWFFECCLLVFENYFRKKTRIRCFASCRRFNNGVSCKYIVKIHLYLINKLYYINFVKNILTGLIWFWWLVKKIWFLKWNFNTSRLEFESKDHV